MKRNFTFFSIILISMLFFSYQAAAQTINVIMRLNTSTNLDTLGTTDFVQLRGEILGGGTVTPPLTWDENSGVILQNIGGDYWEANFQMTVGTVIKYKFWTGFSPTQGTAHWSGWEGPLNSPAGDGNRHFIAGGFDSVVVLQFYNYLDGAKPQYWRPYSVKQDTVSVYFRVNMAAYIQNNIFDPNVNGPVAVRGGAPLSWDTSRVTLDREAASAGATTFWAGVLYIPKSELTAGSQQNFKFMVEDIDQWEDNIGDRTFIYSDNLVNVTSDTTIHWVYFNNQPPFSGTQVQATITWRLKLEALETMGLFDRGVGDNIMVIGPHGWVIPDDGIPMTYNPTLQEWLGQETFLRFTGEEIIYKYYIDWDSSRVDTTSPNYIPALTLDNGWEEPGVTGGADRRHVYTSETQQYPVGDFGRQYQFFNSIPPEGAITTPITMRFHIDMSNAADPDSNSANTLFRPGIDTAYVQFDGAILAITQGMGMWTGRVMLEDPDGDVVYTGTLNLDPSFPYQVCYRIVYTSPTGEVINGGGVAYGRRYYQYIHPTSITPLTWPSDFDLPEMPWRPGDLIVEIPPDLIVGVDNEEQIPVDYSVSQNYPNPFNPVTTVSYSLPVRSSIQIQVYDITGGLIKTLLNTEQDAGKH